MGINDYLKELDEQKVQEESEIQVVGNSSVELLCKTLERWFEEIKRRWPLREQYMVDDKYTYDVKKREGERDYDYCTNLVKGIEYTSKDVGTFSIRLLEYKSNPWFVFSGMFLSALINNCEEENFEVITRHLEGGSFYGLYQLCYKNTKNVTILGFGGSSLCEEMLSGKVTVNSDVCIDVDEIMNGEIHAEGKNCSLLGFHPSMFRRSYPCKAKIYHKGVLVWPK